MDYPQNYWDFHNELDAFVRSNFTHVQSGIQSDSWICITEGEDEVAIDTFSSMKHQVKAASETNPLVQRVIDTLLSRYKLRVYPEPELEEHEDF